MTNYEEYKKVLSDKTKVELEAIILNGNYNRFCSNIDESYLLKLIKSLNGKEESDMGKSIPYLGWFWRTTDFYNKDISIGKAGSVDGNIWWDGDGYVGIMENNKWGYSERKMSVEEADTFIAFIDKLMAIENRGGTALEGEKEKQKNDFTDAVKEMNKWFGSLADVGEWSEAY